MTKRCLILVVLFACGGNADFYQFNWGFSCPDGTWFICRDGGYFHCASGPTDYEPGPACTFVSAECTSNPRPDQSESQAACFPTPPPPPPPTCAMLTTEDACLARADCDPIYNGIDCTNQSGTTCHGGDPECTCAQYVFGSCIARP